MSNASSVKGYALTAKDRDVILQMAQLNFEGHIIPHMWWQHLRFPNGKPHVNAALVLADIVYWYRPVLVRDEKTGQIKGYRKRFKADMLQRDYHDLEMLYGMTRNQAKAACDYLRDKVGVIVTDLRNITRSEGKPAANVMYIGLNVDTLKRITFEDIGVLEDDPSSILIEDTPPILNSNDGPSLITVKDGGQLQLMTYTKNTTETTTEIYSADADSKLAEMKGDETIGIDDPQPRPEPKPVPPTPSKKHAARGRRTIQTEPLVFPAPAPAPPPTPEQAAADLAAFNAIEGASGRELPPPTGTSKDAIERAILDKCYGNDKDLRAAGLGEARKWARHIRDLNASLETPITAEMIYTVYSAPDGPYYKSFMSQNGNGGRKPPTPGIIGKHTLNILHAAEQSYKPERVVRPDVPLPFGMEIAADLASLFR